MKKQRIEDSAYWFRKAKMMTVIWIVTFVGFIVYMILGKNLLMAVPIIFTAFTFKNITRLRKNAALMRELEKAQEKQMLYKAKYQIGWFTDN